MQLIQLQYFCAVARCRNMRIAAEELCVSQPALSKAVGGLEEELGVRLFDRVGRGLILNEAGRTFYHQVSHILLLLDDSVRSVRRIKNAKRRDISVLFTAATFLAPRIRDEFIARRPDISVEIKCSYSPDPQDVRECDFHVYATPEAAASGMTSIKLIEEPLLLACNKKHELAQRGEIELAETKDYPYQCLPPHENLHENLVNGCRKAGFELEIAFCTEDSYAFFSGLGSGGCLTMVPEYTAFMEPQDGLALLRIRSPRCVRTLFIASHRGRELDEKCLAFQAFCFDFFRNMVENRSQRA